MKLIKRIFIITFYSIFIILVSFLIIFDIQNSNKNEELSNALVLKGFSGKLIKIEPFNRGFSLLTVKINEFKNEKVYLHVSWHIKRYNISEGDSVVKKENSKEIIFIRSNMDSNSVVCTYKLQYIDQ